MAIVTIIIIVITLGLFVAVHITRQFYSDAPLRYAPVNCGIIHFNS